MINALRRATGGVCGQVTISTAFTSTRLPFRDLLCAHISAGATRTPACRLLHTGAALRAYGYRGNDRGSNGRGRGGGYSSRSNENIDPRFAQFGRRPGSRNGYDRGNVDTTNVASTGDYTPKFTKFQELADEGLVHPNIIRAITYGMGHDIMTDVQAMTISETIKGADAIAQARTGTGKTIGFLLPVLSNILKNRPDLTEPIQRRYGSRGSEGDRQNRIDVQGIIISPTRELANQIADEAAKLCQGTGIIVQAAVGGMGKRESIRDIRRMGCNLLVATPGRLYDLLTDPYSGIKATNLRSLVLDEADRLLDDGFSRDIEQIIEVLPNRDEVDRQTLLFSATVPKSVMDLVSKTLKPDFHVVQTVKAGEASTHERIPQHIVTCKGIENFMPALLELSKRGISEATEDLPFKAIVYANQTNCVTLFADTFANLKAPGGSMFGKHPLHPAQISLIHGQLTQMQRTQVTERFRRSKSAILFSSDVTARGMDFPGVTHVIQIGVARDRDQYIHRVGRTGRGSKGGEGWVFITPDEMPKARRYFSGLPLKPNTTLVTAEVDMTRDAQLPADAATTLQQVGDATKMVDRDTKVNAYAAMLNGATAPGSLQAMQRWTRYGWGWEEPPSPIRSQAERRGFGSGGFGSGRFGGSSAGSSDRSRSGSFERSRGSGGRSFGRGGRGRGSGGRNDRGEDRDYDRRDRY